MSEVKKYIRRFVVQFCSWQTPGDFPESPLFKMQTEDNGGESQFKMQAKLSERHLAIFQV